MHTYFDVTKQIIYSLITHKNFICKKKFFFHCLLQTLSPTFNLMVLNVC